VKEKRCTQRNLRTQIAYESCLAANLDRGLIEGNPPTARSRLSSVDDPASIVKNILTIGARSHEFGVTIGQVDAGRGQFRFRQPMLAGALSCPIA
jgi:hypothetical protein